MAQDTYALPKNKEKLAQILDQHALREEGRLSWKWTMWNLAWHYLQGARRFDVFDPATRRIRAHYLDDEGNMEFQCQELLSAIDRVSGTIAGMDLRPKVLRSGTSLPIVRDRSVAQIILDAIVSEDQLEGVQGEFAYFLTCLGCVGVTSSVLDHPSVGLTADLEIVHPRELMPFPSLGTDHTKVRGIMRQRMVSIDFLKERFGRRIVSNLQKMRWYERQWGDVPHDPDQSVWGEADTSLNVSGTTNDDMGGPSNRGPMKDDAVGLVQIRELWIKGHLDLVERYVITSGEYVIHDEDFTGLEVHCPVGVARFMNNGSFHGVGLFELLFSINRQMELLLKSLFNNIRDTDRYGIVVLPSGQFNERSMLRDVGRGLRVMNWEPDAIDPGFKPFTIQPFNLGDVPGKTAAFARELMQSINPWQDLLREKGRVDSAAGLGFLDEKTKELMVTCSRSSERAWGELWRATLSSAAQKITNTDKALPVKTLTPDLAGAIIDSESGSVSFRENPVPVVSHLRFSIRDISPKSALVRKQEAMEMLAIPGFDDPLRLIILSLEEGLDLPTWLEEERNAYEAVVRNILVLYGDGVSPTQPVIVTPHTAAPNLQLRVLSAFMASPKMQVASPAVQDEFLRYRDFLLEASGVVLPNDMPNPDDIMAMASPAEAMMMQQGGPSPMGPQPGPGMGAGSMPMAS